MAAPGSRSTSALETVVDSLGRKLTVRSLTALDKLRLFKAAGPELSRNEPWLALAALASSVTSIDDVPIPFPAHEIQIEALVAKLDEPGLEAIAKNLEASFDQDDESVLDKAGNLFGTPT